MSRRATKAKARPTAKARASSESSAKEPRFFTPEDLRRFAREDPSRLLEAALMQIEQLVARSGQLTEARAQLAAAQQRIAELERQKARQAAPFRVPEQKRTTAPKRPGRKPGHPGSFRLHPEQVDEEIVVPLGACPHCGEGHWCAEREIEQFIEELPEVRPHVTRLCTYEATCGGCGETTTSSHPRQVSSATGAAAVALGPRALAIAADLNKSKGLTMRSTCAVLRDHFALRLTPGGLSQALDRVADKVGPQYDQLGGELLEVPALHVDETSWWVGGKPQWLWVFTHPGGTYYRVDPSRARGVLEGVLGDGFPGVLISDCLSVYDLRSGEQQKCYAHHLKAISTAIDLHPDEGRGFLADIKELLQDALALGRQRAAAPLDPITDRLAQLEARAATLLAEPCARAEEESVRNRLAKQSDHLFTFLRHDGIDATNNLAERQLRPAVIARKISCGNKTQAGAHTFEVLASLAATCRQIGSSFIDLIASAIPFNSS